MDIIASAIRNPALLCEHRVPHNITMLVENRVADSSIAKLLRTNSRVFQKCEMLNLVEELKNLGFNPSKTTFGVALEAKLTVNKTLWKEKFDAFKKWEWSDEDAHEAFRKKPHCMLVSINKINLVMSFWVNQLGWDVLALAKGPSVLSNSLEKSIIPRASVVQFLLKKGLRKKDASLTCPFVVSEQSIEELKDLGINPSRISFGIALKAKLTVSKTLWKEKVNAFKKWGWSDEDVREAFKKMPHCMLASIDKINLVMSFWVNQLGWDALALVKGPAIFSNSLDKRIIPRASVVQFLLKKGLRKKDASLTYPFVVSEQLFLDMFIKPFKEDSSYLLKLYEEKLSLAQTRDKTSMS
ncbi:unnamed protein product [Trifolium pratense]|uniref:Uncharacterized protein n=1 Tax=Trifolium pratense TaxID=57577 RepID=A0ACB0L1R9_TRIPR|nr:unnamed protein product [Trifolium pratense]